jgi:hypothetical protein
VRARTGILEVGAGRSPEEPPEATRQACLRATGTGILEAQAGRAEHKAPEPTLLLAVAGREGAISLPLTPGAADCRQRAVPVNQGRALASRSAFLESRLLIAPEPARVDDRAIDFMMEEI